MFNWTKQDVELIDAQLNIFHFYKHKGVLFYHIPNDSVDVFHQSMSQFVESVGGACFMKGNVSWIDSVLEQYPDCAAADAKMMIDIDENNQYLSVMLTSGLFKPERTDIRQFIIAHEMAHLENNDQNNPLNNLEGYEGDVNQEFLADKLAVEIMGTRKGAVDMFDLVVTKAEQAGLHNLPEDVRKTVMRGVDMIRQRATALL